MPVAASNGSFHSNQSGNFHEILVDYTVDDY